MLELRVLNGLHQGAVVPLDDKPIIVGGSLNVDLHLADPGIRDRHMSIRPEGAGHLLTPGEGPVRNTSGRAIRGSITVKNGLRVCLAGLWLEIQPAEAPWPDPDTLPPPPDPAARLRAQKFRRFGPLPLVVAVVAVTFWTLAVAQGFKSSDNTKANSGSTLVATAEPVSGAGNNWATNHEKLTRALNNDPSDNRLRARLYSMLNEREISDGVRLTVADDHWVIEGALPEARLPVLHRMLLRFDRETKPGFEIRNEVTAQQLQLPFEVVQVSSGPFASILTRSGARLYEGDSKAGFTLVAIEPNRLVFDGPQRLAMTW